MYPHPARIYGDIVPRSEFIRSLVRQGTISQGAAKRLRWFDHYAQFKNARLIEEEPKPIASKGWTAMIRIVYEIDPTTSS